MTALYLSSKEIGQIRIYMMRENAGKSTWHNFRPLYQELILQAKPLGIPNAYGEPHCLDKTCSNFRPGYRRYLGCLSSGGPSISQEGRCGSEKCCPGRRVRSACLDCSALHRFSMRAMATGDLWESSGSPEKEPSEPEG